MCKSEMSKFDAALTSYEKKVSYNKGQSQKLLIKIGVITEKGNLRKPYKNLCTQQDRG